MAYFLYQAEVGRLNFFHAETANKHPGRAQILDLVICNAKKCAGTLFPYWPIYVVFWLKHWWAAAVSTWQAKNQCDFMGNVAEQ